MKNETKITDMLLFLSTDGSRVWLLPEVSKKFGKEVILKPYSRKREHGEKEAEALKLTFKKHFDSVLLPKMERAGKIKKDDIEFNFYLASGQGISFPAGSICLPLSKVMKGSQVLITFNKKQCKAKPTPVLSQGLELPSSL